MNQRTRREATIDSSTKRRLLIGFVTNWVTKLANTIVQLVQVPLFFEHWSASVYGNWLVVSAVPSYLAFSSVGFGSVASNEMTMLNSAGDREGALRVFQSCWWLIALVCGIVGVLLAPVLYFIPLSTLLNVHAISDQDVKWIVFYLGLSVLLGQLEQLIGAAYTCVARYSLGQFLKSLITLVCFAVSMVPVVLNYGPRSTAKVFAISNSLGTLLLMVLVRQHIPWLRFGWQHARISEIRKLAPMAFAFMGFPVGNALNLQGTLMAVGYAMGPIDVAIFASARTVSRVALQMVQMVNNTFWPELSIAYGAGKLDVIRALHRRACQVAIIFAAAVALAMMTFGPWFLTHWTRGHVPPSRPLLTILLVVVIVYSLWSTSATLQQAINRHQRLAIWYTVATGVTVALTYVLAKTVGLTGAAASLILSELIMNTYVLPQSLRLSHDTWGGFLRSMLHYPKSLTPGELLIRLRRSKPQFEAE